MRGFSLVVSLILLVLAGCQVPPLPPAKPVVPVEKPAPIGAENALRPVSWSELPMELTLDEHPADWAEALGRSADYYAKRPATESYRFGQETISAPDMARACAALTSVAKTNDSQRLKDYLREHFRLMRSVGSDELGAVLVTSYYEPLLHGSRVQSKRYRYPLYRKPADLLEVDLSQWRDDWKGKTIFGRLERNRVVPYHDRSAIDQRQVLKGSELLWVDDPVDRFFLQIQGSGRVLLQEGGVVRVGYHAANGRPYRSIGTLLIREEQIPKESMSMPALRQWLRTHPEERERIFNYNPSYVFFKEQDGGPFGNIGLTLTGGRSIATDAKIFPKGAPAVLITELPEFAADGQTVASWRPMVRLVVNQDTGGAIQGPGRVDFFMGFGPEAERIAGVIKQPGSLYFIVPKL